MQIVIVAGSGLLRVAAAMAAQCSVKVPGGGHRLCQPRSTPEIEHYDPKKFKLLIGEAECEVVWRPTRTVAGRLAQAERLHATQRRYAKLSRTAPGTNSLR